MVLSKGQFEKIAAGLAQPGETGFSVNIVTGESPTSGYMVSEPDTEEDVPVGPARPLVGFARNHKEALVRPGAHMGGWKPEGSDVAFLDRSRNIDEPSNPDVLTSAMDIALAHRQEAIYDVAGDRSIMSPDWKHWPRERKAQ